MTTFMLPDINKIKGIHPGLILKREIKKRGVKNKELAAMINEHPQTLSGIMNAKRNINPKLSLKLAEAFTTKPEYFMILQVYYDMKIAKDTRQIKRTPNMEKIRKILFWDTDFDSIDWQKNKRAVIQRIFERGNKTEIQEIIRFYGLQTVKKELEKIGGSYLPAFQKNIDKYI